jgi:hypothetical protein
VAQELLHDPGAASGEDRGLGVITHADSVQRGTHEATAVCSSRSMVIVSAVLALHRSSGWLVPRTAVTTLTGLPPIDYELHLSISSVMIHVPNACTAADRAYRDGSARSAFGVLDLSGHSTDGLSGVSSVACARSARQCRAWATGAMFDAPSQ